MSRIAVFGTGSWGSAFSGVLADAGGEVRMWGREPEVVAEINESGTNKGYVPALQLPDTVSATLDPAEALEGADIIVLAIPSQVLRPNLVTWGPMFPTGAAVVSLMKGVELGTTKRMSEVIEDAGKVPREQVVVISGPNLAREIAVKQPAGAVVACVDEATAGKVAQACAAPYFRPYTSTDVVGAELGGATKNVIALAVGMAEGLGYGDNTKATIITRGLAETVRLGVALGADPATFAGLAGVGDLIATCMSPLSRNHTFGKGLGEGKSVEQVAKETKQTAEGVKSCQSILELAQHHGVDVPIVASMAALVHEGRSVEEVVNGLLNRPLKAETD